MRASEVGPVSIAYWNGKGKKVSVSGMVELEETSPWRRGLFIVLLVVDSRTPNGPFPSQLSQKYSNVPQSNVFADL